MHSWLEFSSEKLLTDASLKNSTRGIDADSALCPMQSILVATGRLDRAALDLAEAHPFVALLSKPFAMRTLQERLQGLGR